MRSLPIADLRDEDVVARVVILSALRVRALSEVVLQSEAEAVILAEPVCVSECGRAIFVLAIVLERCVRGRNLDFLVKFFIFDVGIISFLDSTQLHIGHVMSAGLSLNMQVAVLVGGALSIILQEIVA